LIDCVARRVCAERVSNASRGETPNALGASPARKRRWPPSRRARGARRQGRTGKQRQGRRRAGIRRAQQHAGCLRRALRADCSIRVIIQHHLNAGNFPVSSNQSNSDGLKYQKSVLAQFEHSICFGPSSFLALARFALSLKSVPNVPKHLIPVMASMNSAIW